MGSVSLRSERCGEFTSAKFPVSGNPVIEAKGLLVLG
jgi:hypothetical protein